MNHELYKIYKQRKVEKHYITLVLGKLKNQQGILKDYLKATRRNFKSFTEITTKKDPKARYAECSYKIKKQYKNHTLLELNLKTGRMHQIRVQLSSRGHPVVGDKLYDKKDKHLKRQFLHANFLSFKHPITNKILKIEAPLSQDLKKVLSKLQ